ncbi:hypothetical protein ABK905_07700 [Acerihabitans sp. KWT182]|uniref:Uncharacterized protein n=1 Tax=Acerihabitans sp. KWT182 TaxID=3157919 RepID=A0AAU7QCW2_9GAMM
MNSSNINLSLNHSMFPENLAEDGYKNALPAHLNRVGNNDLSPANDVVVNDNELAGRGVFSFQRNQGLAG